jgi:hypothetical protein
MGMHNPDRPCMKNARVRGPQFGCGRDMRSPEQIASDPYDTGVHCPIPTSTSPSGGEVAELNATIAALQSQVATLTTTNDQLQERLSTAKQYAEDNDQNFIKSIQTIRDGLRLLDTLNTVASFTWRCIGRDLTLPGKMHVVEGDNACADPIAAAEELSKKKNP